jgi:hypothetical protein
MNIVEQRYDFLVDMGSLPKLEGAMFEARKAKRLNCRRRMFMATKLGLLKP